VFESKDPVCGMDVRPDGSHRAIHLGREYLFCSSSCKSRFLSAPEDFLDPDRRAAREAQQDPAALYLCPMHPEVEQIGPGTCPKCGMALEPSRVSIDTPEDTSELDDMTRRLVLSSVFAFPVFLLAMGEMLPGRPLDGWLFPHQRVWVECLLATPVVFWGGWPIFQRAWQSVQHRSPNMFTLTGIGVGVAYGYSVVATLFPASFPEAFRTHGIVAVYFEAAAVITASGCSHIYLSCVRGGAVWRRSRHYFPAWLRSLFCT